MGDMCAHGHCQDISPAIAEYADGPVLAASSDPRLNDWGQRLPPSRPGSPPERPPRV